MLLPALVLALLTGWHVTAATNSSLLHSRDGLTWAHSHHDTRPALNSSLSELFMCSVHLLHIAKHSGTAEIRALLKQTLDEALKAQGYGSSAHRRSTLESTAAAGRDGQHSLHTATARRVGPDTSAGTVQAGAVQQQGGLIYTSSSGRMLRWWPFEWLFGKKKDSGSSGTPESPAADSTTPAAQPKVILPSGFFENQAGAPPDPDEELEKLAPPVSFGPSLAVRSTVQCVVTKLLADPKAHFTCKHDQGAPVGSPQGMKVLAGGNLRNSQKLMAHYTVQMLRFVLASPPGSVYVSIYESDSGDQTPHWLAVMDHLLSAAGVPATIVMRGGVKKGKDELRIPFLAKVRNQVLMPLFKTPHPAHAHGFQADKIIFINDVFTCAQDMTRLLNYMSADIACGMDYNYYRRRHHSARRHMLEVEMPMEAADDDSSISSADHFVGGIEGLAEGRSSRSLLSSPHFYDVWVARDISGQMIGSHSPILKHAPSQQRFSQGWPIPVHCCWNGMAALNAAPFTKHSIRFRSGFEIEGDCRASECSLLCMDFERLGYGRIMIDPAVRVTYDKQSVSDLSDIPFGRVPYRSWSETVAQLGKEGLSGSCPAQGLWTWPQFKASKTVSCCNTDDKGQLDWHSWSSCHAVDLRGGRNSTKDFIDWLKKQEMTPATRVAWAVPQH